MPKKQKPITLRYTINGEKHKRIYNPEQWKEVWERVAALSEFGVHVKIKNWPNRIVMNVPSIASLTAEGA